jgi:hypothetical protein
MIGYPQKPAMNADELTQVATAHESRLDRIEATLERIATQQEANAQEIALNQRILPLTNRRSPT